MENTTQKEKMDAIISKLRKLQKSYEGAKAINSENEAATAAAMINKLLLQYNLTMDQVSSNPEQQRAFVEMYESGYTKKTIGGAWEYRLYYVLCKYNLCRCYMNGSSYKNLFLIGSSENLELVRWMKSMLADRYVEFSKKEYKIYRQKKLDYFEKPKGLEAFQRSYLMGCVAGLESKLEQEKRERENQQTVESGNITALVLRNDNAIKQYVHQRYDVRTVRTNTGARTAEAYNSGYAEGRRTNLGRPISGGASSNNRIALNS